MTYQFSEPINYHRLCWAIDYYYSKGYSNIGVPWTVHNSISNLTKPEDRRNLYLFDTEQVFVASSEQSFIQLMFDGLPEAKYQSLTPCTRDEEILDDIHFNMFMKLELFVNKNVNFNMLNETISDANNFFSNYVNTQIIKLSENEYDIVCKDTNIELGSYGLRTLTFNNNQYSYIYATGIAEPRLSITIQKAKGY